MSSGQGYGSAYNAPQDGFPSTNPWADQVPQSTNQQQQQQQQAQQRPSGYEPPPGPPPRGNTFNEETFVPEDQRGEQREALEQFEMNNTKPESQADRDVAQLSAEFPRIDSSLVAALYSDTQSVAAAREMLTELAASQQ
ncbi:hypothetical protein CB0940_01408 [Cercospora beticola]|uniref:CUE domain-containing protein n=1 Tax=Cercospora beticola TaxID=122368 RepID=A0A2G5IBW6_CERBT|nr:hypothetical protein CB0940_01408 [Cercospora beticola]PIB02346.1 hypothetical protein CB0940_01408 [Cercospora beticola]WPA96847.1 hypothetical protein RHO25_001455 [Cercospora beticola]CAK1354782.1 unnamed protein product [Cercospora beticola]